MPIDRIARTCEGCGSVFYVFPCKVKRGWAKFCNWACRYPGSSVERFWARVDRSDPDGCWPWTGGYSGNYGAAYVNGRIGHAHRFAYELTYGPIESPDIFACHSCDNPPCCRPDHVFLGTADDNVRDKIRKGRSNVVRGMRRHPESVKRGEASPNARLTEAEVIEIRRAYAAGEADQKTLAARFDTPQTNISRIILRKAWAHV